MNSRGVVQCCGRWLPPGYGGLQHARLSQSLPRKQMKIERASTQYLSLYISASTSYQNSDSQVVWTVMTVQALEGSWCARSVQNIPLCMLNARTNAYRSALETLLPYSRRLYIYAFRVSPHSMSRRGLLHSWCVHIGSNHNYF